MKNLENIGGWHRLWIVLSIIYLVIVIFITATEFPQNASDTNPDKILKLMDSDKSQYIVEAYKYEPYSTETLPANEYLIEIPEKHFLKIRIPENFFEGPWILYQLSDALNKNSSENGFSQSTRSPRSPDVTSMSNEELFAAAGKTPSEDQEKDWKFRAKPIHPLNSKEIEKGKEFLKSVVLDYQKNISRALNEDRISTIVVALFSWAIPMGIIYFLGWSIGWIFKGFRRSKVGNN